MGLYRFKRRRIVQMLVLVFLTATTLHYGRYYIGQVEENKPEPTKQLKIPKLNVAKKSHTTRMSGNDVMTERIQTVHDRCDKHIYGKRRLGIPIATNAHRPFYRYSRSKTCMCKVPKVASTMLSKLLLMVEYPNNATYIQNMPGHSMHGSVLTSHFQRSTCYLKKDLKFMVVRNPYSRIFSAYIDKIFLGKFKTFATKVQHFLGHNESVQSYFQRSRSGEYDCSMDYNVTFETFLRWILYHYRVDWHFAPITIFCNPCIHDFDVIIKQENVRNEIGYVTEHLPDNVDTTSVTEPSNDEKIHDLIHVLNEIWNHSLHNEDCDKSHVNYTFINQRFWEALKIQGYISMDFPNNIHVFTPYSSNEEVYERFKVLKVPYLSSHDRSAQRHHYLVKAYQSINKDLIEQLQYRFHADFYLFDYDINPPS